MNDVSNTNVGTATANAIGRQAIVEHGAQPRSKWTLRFTNPITNKRRDAGTGVYPEVAIADAREKTLAVRCLLDAGKDPIDERDREQQAAATRAAALTFEKAACKVHEAPKPGRLAQRRAHGPTDQHA